jgi:imidazoleglycerol-phosphate dehydratase/histidinol-phosphatase
MRKVLFVDRDGTLIEDDAGKSPTSPGDVRLMRGVIPALLRFKAAGYELVIVTNQGGLGTPSYPREPFERVDAFVHGLLASQGIEFAANFICPHPAEAGCACRKPGIGLVRD